VPDQIETIKGREATALRSMIQAVDRAPESRQPVRERPAAFPDRSDQVVNAVRIARNQRIAKQEADIDVAHRAEAALRKATQCKSPEESVAPLLPRPLQRCGNDPISLGF